MGAGLTDEAVSDMVRVIRDAGGGVCMGMKTMVMMTMRSCECVRSVSDRQTSLHHPIHPVEYKINRSQRDWPKTIVIGQEKVSDSVAMLVQGVDCSGTLRHGYLVLRLLLQTSSKKG